MRESSSIETATELVGLRPFGNGFNGERILKLLYTTYQHLKQLLNENGKLRTAIVTFESPIWNRRTLNDDKMKILLFFPNSWSRESNNKLG